MKINDLKERLHKDRPMTTVSLRMPEDVLEDLKRLASQLGFSGYEPLIRTYVGQGLRADLARLDSDPDVAYLIECLRQRGVSDDVIAAAVAEARVRSRAA